MKQSKNKQVVIGESTKKNIYLQDIEQETQAFILQNNPQLTAESMITLAELLNYRLDYMKQLVANDSEKIQQLNELVVQHIKEDKLISNNMNEKMEKKLSLPAQERLLPTVLDMFLRTDCQKAFFLPSRLVTTSSFLRLTN